MLISLLPMRNFALRTGKLYNKKDKEGRKMEKAVVRTCLFLAFLVDWIGEQRTSKSAKG